MGRSEETTSIHWNMVLQRLFVSLLALNLVRGFSISNHGSDIGTTVENPANSGENEREIRLTCDLQFNQGEKWTTCTWSHSFEDVWAYDGRQAFVMCSATHLNEHGEICDDQGNIKDGFYGNDASLNPYTEYNSDRLQISVAENSCGLTITSPHANDTGIWTCKVNDNNPMGTSTTMWAEVELFVAVQSEVVMSYPDLTEDPGQSLEIDLSNSYSEELEAECTALDGSPPPSLIWYIDEPTNEISTADVEEDVNNDGTVVSSIRFQLDRSSMARYGIRTVNNNFAFSLGCYPDQGNYFDTIPIEGRNPAEVLVFGVTNNAFRLFQSGFLIIVICFLYSL